MPLIKKLYILGTMENSQPHTFPNDPISYLAPTWDELNHLAFIVSQQIIQQKQDYNRIVTIAKGGWPMTRSLTDFLSIQEIASIGAKFYCGVNQRLPTPDIYQDIPIKVKGEKLLLFDDVADTGESLIFTKKYLHDKGARLIDTATLFYKPHSKLKPDFFGAQTHSWIIFPFEQFETMKLLNKKWSKQGLTQKEIFSRFTQLNFRSQFIEAANKDFAK